MPRGLPQSPQLWLKTQNGLDGSEVLEAEEAGQSDI
jgi:hypothetical protein